ncbi:unnamed protein product [Phytophthora fragariaefolia]|uniref:Unnamed protein product n=1 Tax=Phytophthora fragariaefolia TaxID=1490495 RepID=A0A9W6XHX2_9STRA|nr:unnamed protein product [Phytophthora fragariaefolia]
MQNESNGSNSVISVRHSTRTEIYSEPANVKPRPLDFIGLALQPRRESRTVERTDVRSFRSRRSVTDYSDQTGRAGSHNESGQWATTPLPNPAARYVSPPISPKEHVPLRRNLRYAGKKVITAIRLKSAMPDNEKLQLMQLMLQKHASPTKAKQ